MKIAKIFNFHLFSKKTILLTLLGLCSISAKAQVTYNMVVIGNPGNSNDKTGFGGVTYTYQIGKYEVTIGEYAEFLNAVASESDPYGLWNSSMTIPNIQGISRSGSSGNYSYSVINASSVSGSSINMPITGVSWFSAARFANWMSNGQPTGIESAGTTENGAYALNGKKSGTTVSRNTINPNTNRAPTYYIPTENEWYKAAFFNGRDYYVYATQHNTTPSNIIGDSSNAANFLSDATTGYSVPQSMLYSSSQTYLTNVGTFINSISYYGTFDQNGSVWEWTDMDGSVSYYRSLKGGAWTSTPPYLQSSYRLVTVPSTISVNSGFRLAGSI